MYLAYHVELEEYRAVKVVPKSIADYDTFRKEALFLKTLRHPGIPIVYDVEEDTGYSYLIEEYLEGESLYALVKRLGSLSMVCSRLTGTRQLGQGDDRNTQLPGDRLQGSGNLGNLLLAVVAVLSASRH